ncbi:DUF1893 domain-containing protein [Borreliella burgdorferi]|uniref:DUF1893 domain-containing protein n=10 Tax=Borreliella TaxID=64895 RepID=O51390_BORBU|nr:MULTISPECIES: DUF1893 domain-containing protein [Borreliella]AGS66440.1 hypothetical protein L144_02095 [Borreliella burgdorferi CA382]EOA80230.1 hypothetical protein BBUCA8_02102 [Borreliella burgdorferi CA8]AAC66810.1 conserved hypothetical protein [Borreliella burgdorferi B31]ACK74786.1 conserved hypothetical protein [Borreliella burgdorferi ZS7]ADQ29339.1 conserved hypothetical protein [Borreliella burgdorferi N40]
MISGLNPTLRLFKDHKILYSNMERGLKPLLEVDNFINKYIQNKEGLEIYDKVVGKAAAVIIYNIGLQNVQAGVVSQPAKDFLESRGIKVAYKKLVEKINDRAESLIESLENPEEVYKYMIKRGIIVNNL